MATRHQDKRTTSCEARQPREHITATANPVRSGPRRPPKPKSADRPYPYGRPPRQARCPLRGRWSAAGAEHPTTMCAPARKSSKRPCSRALRPMAAERLQLTHGQMATPPPPTLKLTINARHWLQSTTARGSSMTPGHIETSRRARQSWAGESSSRASSLTPSHPSRRISARLCCSTREPLPPSCQRRSQLEHLWRRHGHCHLSCRSVPLARARSWP